MDNMGRRALAWAAVGGHEDVVKILLQCKDVNTDTTDAECARTTLSLAVQNEHKRVVMLLLEREDITTLQTPEIVKSHSCGPRGKGMRES